MIDPYEVDVALLQRRRYRILPVCMTKEVFVGHVVVVVEVEVLKAVKGVGERVSLVGHLILSRTNFSTFLPNCFDRHFLL